MKSTSYLLILFIVLLLTACSGSKNLQLNSIVEPASDTTVIYSGAKRYKAKPIKQLFLGKHYRRDWYAPIEVQVLDITKEKGGLTAIKKGGGMQTLSLRFKNPEGKQFVIRSVDKDPSSVLPKELQHTAAAELLQDQISASHPYGAIIVPKMADAIGIYHTNPKLVYVPDDPNMGEYREEFKGMLALFEERPHGDESDNSSFGNAEKIVGTPDVFEKILSHNNHRVDQKFFLRNRLFDMIIGDWDRHEDQWRWAVFEEKSGKKYRAIPRDRDQALFSMDGILPWIASRKWAIRKMQFYSSDIRDVPGFNFNARYLDHRFLSELEWKDWEKVALKIQEKLTDEIIESALRDWPEPVYDIRAKEIKRKLEGRRDKLVDIARKHYLFLAKEVDIVGTNQREEFRVRRLNDEETEVKIFDLDKKGKKDEKIFERIFIHKETKEIRLYGMGGGDEFKIDGDVRKGIKIRIIAGTGEDEIKDKSSVSGIQKKTWVYDTPAGYSIEKGQETNLKVSNDTLLNNYDYKSFKYDLLAPAIFFGYNPDDKAFIGGGILLKTHGFRKDPHKSLHAIAGTYAFATSAFKFKYIGDFRQVLGKFSVRLDALVNMPQYVDNFFGMGNETLDTAQHSDYNWVGIRQVKILPMIYRKFGEHHRVSFGPEYQYLQGEKTTDESFLEIPESGLTQASFKGAHYLGATAKYELDYTDKRFFPKNGVRFNFEAEYQNRLDEIEEQYMRIASDLSFYFTPNKDKLFQTTLAVRVGTEVNHGDFPFFLGSRLGGTNNLRGHRRSRYTGKRMFYQNTELRIKLFQFRSYLFPIQVGINGFADIGRVWVEDDPSTTSGKSDVLHKGFGGGVWLAPAKVAVISVDYSVSKVDKTLFVRFGFLF